MVLLSLDNWEDVRVFRLSEISAARFTLENYQLIVTQKNLPRLYITTLLMSAAVSIGGGIIATAAGYGMLKASRRMRAFTIAIIAIATAVPISVIVIPLFIEMHYLRLSGIPAVLLKGTMVSSGVIVAWQYMKGIPQGYFDSATIDGAGDLQMLWHILIPISKPLFALTAIGQGITFTGDYLWQSLNLIKVATQTAVVAMANLVVSTSFSMSLTNVMRRVNIEMAAEVAMLIPMALIFFIGRRHLLNFTLEGGIKQ
jgi:ABC-type glycerol-3-phosphate transport system permease component